MSCDAPPTPLSGESDASRKRARLITLAEQAAVAAEEAAKKAKIAADFAEDLHDLYPNYPGAEDAADFLGALARQTAKTWTAALEGQTIFQESAEIIELHARNKRRRDAERLQVSRAMDMDMEALSD